MTIYFDRTLPLFLTDESTFDGIAVNITGDAVQFVMDIRELQEQIAVAIDVSGAPEDYNQELADMFAAGLQEIWESNYGPDVSRPTLIANPSPSVPSEGD